MGACLGCGYDLRGLPEEGCCPECGLGYDRHSKLIRFAPGRRDWRNLAYAALLLALLAWTGTQTGFNRLDAYFVAIVLAGVGAAVWRLTKTAGQACELSINGQGVAFKHPALPDSRIPWGLIGRARCGMLTRKLYLEARDGRRLLACKYDWIGGARMARGCAREINALRQAYTAELDGRTI